jgi:hypothetical protein
MPDASARPADIDAGLRLSRDKRGVPPLKGEVGEQSEPGGVSRSDRTCREAPTRPPVASLPAVDLPRKTGEVLSLWHCVQFTETCLSLLTGTDRVSGHISWRCRQR